MTTPNAVVFGVSGTSLTADERAFLRDADPLGFILFGRNCADAASIRRLTAELREAVGRGDAPVLIDQEGGRVMRLRPPDWPFAPAARDIADLHDRDSALGVAAAETVGRMFGAMLSDLGIDVDCAPVLDLGLPETTDAIGTRAYAADPDTIALLGGAMARGLIREGCLPVIKHLPGHGRGGVDSHKELPRVDADLATLRRHDFAAFRPLNHLPLGMSAHVVYSAVDPDRPGTVSAAVIETLVRGEVGFDGFLFTDDIAMEALDGTPAFRAAAALSAGCDAVLHCTGVLSEMVEVAGAVGHLSQSADRRWTRARAARQKPEGADVRELAETLAAQFENRT
ncbi:MAG: beta-N-acetylhexosaminidase [Proteobacteria bacterium]|nr:beta-N-acetylhexosaminidase [Pseudomonadota bacterium]